MIPASLRRVIDQQNAGPRGDLTTIWRDGRVIREPAFGPMRDLMPIDGLPCSFPGTADNPFPHD
jgi:hypothetical protein